MESNSSIFDVISGNEAVQIEFKFDVLTTGLLALFIFLALTGALLLYKKM